MCVSVSLCVCLSVCNALTFQSSYLVCRHISSEYLGHVHMSRSSGEGQGHRSKRSMSVYPVSGWSAFDWEANLFTLNFIGIFLSFNWFLLSTNCCHKYQFPTWLMIMLAGVIRAVTVFTLHCGICGTWGVVYRADMTIDECVDECVVQNVDWEHSDTRIKCTFYNVGCLQGYAAHTS